MKRIINILLCWMVFIGLAAQDRFYINDFAINPGETKQVEILLDNAIAYTALQADIFLPEGLSIEEEDGEYIFDLTDRKARNHTISSTTLSSGAIRILIASQTLKEFNGNSGPLVTFNIIADESFSGQKMIEMNNILASEASMTEHSLPDESCTVTEEGFEPPVSAEDRFYINDFSINASETKEIEMILDNPTAFTALQADIFLPEGLSIEEEDGEYIFDLTDRKARNHTISSTSLSSGAIRILIASQTLKEFNGNSGALVTFQLTASSDFQGPKTIVMNNIIASEADMTQHNLPDETCIVSTPGGEQPPTPVQSLELNCKMAKLAPNATLQLAVTTPDAGAITWASEDESVATVDQNGHVTAIKPGMVAINAMAANGATTWCALFVNMRGDTNLDGHVSIVDVTSLIDYLLSGRWPED